MTIEAKRLARLALIQFESELCEPEGNVARACGMIAQAAAQGADLVALPELFSTGYRLDVVGPRLSELAEPLDGPTVRALQQAAREAGCYVIGCLALAHDRSGAVYNSAVLIDRAGQVMGTYDKQHLWTLERHYFQPGAGTPVFDVDFGRIGLLICYDLGFPEVARMLALKGAELLVCPSAWADVDMDAWDIETPCRALENTVILAALNRYGREGDLYMPGRTRVCGPRGTVLAELPGEAEGVLQVDVDLGSVARQRATSSYLRDRRPELYRDVLLSQGQPTTA